MNFKKLMQQFRLMNGLDDVPTGGGDVADTPAFDMDKASDSIGADIFGGEEADGQPSEPTETPARKEPTGEPTQPPAKEGDAPPTDTPTAPPAAPKSWRAEVAADWEKLPPSVQAEVLRREEDFHKGLEGYRANAGIGQSFQEASKPFMPLLAQQGHDPVKLSHQLMQAHAVLSLGTAEQKYAQVTAIAQAYGIDLQPVDPEAAPYMDPQTAALQKELQAVKSQLSQTEQWQARQNQQQEQQIRAGLSSEIAAFASDPANLYFDEVANDIAALFNAGLAKDLKDAYQQAVYRNPVTRDKEIQRVATEKAEAARKEAATRAEAARKAQSANVRTRAQPASATTGLGSIDDTLKSAFAEISKRQS